MPPVHDVEHHEDDGGEDEEEPVNPGVPVIPGTEPSHWSNFHSLSLQTVSSLDLPIPLSDLLLLCLLVKDVHVRLLHGQVVLYKIRITIYPYILFAGGGHLAPQFFC